jgi:histidinol-phosphatase (PHP family)
MFLHLIFFKQGLSLETLAKQFEDFLAEAHRLKSSYASRITLLVGLETEYITSHDLDCLHDLLFRHAREIEYVVGSVHHVNSIPIDFDLATYHTAVSSCSNLDVYLTAYLDAQYDLITRFQPEIIGHIDLCKLYTPDLKLRDHPVAWARLERNVIAAIAYGALFEVNAAAFRKGWDTAYPGLDIISVRTIFSSLT